MDDTPANEPTGDDGEIGKQAPAHPPDDPAPAQSVEPAPPIAGTASEDAAPPPDRDIGERDTEEQEERDPFGEQLHARAENQDFMRVLQQFVKQLPGIYVENVTVQHDLTLGGQTPVAQPIPPPTRATTELPSADARKVQQVYQRHAAYPRALEILRETQCVVLRGEPGVGKRTAAIKLALEVLPPDGTIHELSPDENLLDQVTRRSGQSKTVMVLDGLLRVCKSITSRAAQAADAGERGERV